MKWELSDQRAQVQAGERRVRRLLALSPPWWLARGLSSDQRFFFPPPFPKGVSSNVVLLCEGKHLRYADSPISSWWPAPSWGRVVWPVKLWGCNLMQAGDICLKQTGRTWPWKIHISKCLQTSVGCKYLGGKKQSIKVIWEGDTGMR